MRLDEFDDASVLIYGIGNVGRQDDGLGWAFVDWLEAQGLCPNAELLRGYQLLLEDAELISTKARVLFVDATKDASVASFTVARAAPKMDFSFTSHAISIPAIMATCQQCFERLPTVHVLAIRGFEFELAMGLTVVARRNLEDATAFLSLRSGQKRYRAQSGNRTVVPGIS
jgi:hydrogenase maturation protease